MERADLEQWKAREVARLLALVETERRYYQEIASSIPVGLLVLSPDFTIISANRAIRKIFSLSSSPLRAKLDSFLPGWLLDRVAEVLKTGAPQTNILLSEPKTGRRLRIGILAIRSWDDEFAQEALLSLEDLTGLEMAGVPVPVRDAPYSASELADNLNAVVWTLELAGTNFLFVSRNAATLLGYPAQHWTSNASFWTDRVHPSDRDWVTQVYRQAIERREGHACEFRAVAADGRILWVREYTRLLADAEGRPRYLIGVTVDVTQRRLLEDQFVQSERVLAVSKLAARLAHDLNNMLMIVTGHSEELLNGLPANSPLRADVQEILNASERMSGLTGHLLSFTRRHGAAAGMVELETVLRAVEQRSGLQFQLSSQPSLVKADPERLEQILMSLIDRGRQVTMETSRVEITEDLRHTASPLRPGEYGVITITLSGRAGEGESKSSWFETVLPGKDSPDDWAGAVTRAYGIIRAWGGDIAASAAPAGGTVLRLYFETVPEAGGKKAALPSAPAGSEPRLETILVVEDEPGIRALVHKILRRHGYEVLEAANGEEALAICREHSGAIDVLVTDVMMPRMGGPELVDRLRKQGLQMKVLYLSGYTDDPNISARNFPPGTAFLEKPFTLSALLDKVREVLSAG
jgi:two-component system, cell cycle sensor histidine kinase and response regulator CckA